MTNPHLHEFKDQQTLCRALSRRICGELDEGIQARGTAGLVVSGGRTPIPFFKELSGMPLEWEKVYVTLADERWVDRDHADSNEALAREHLLKNRAKGASFCGLKNSFPSAAEGEEECEAGLERIPVPFDVVVLGMGPDGHTASFFPGAARLNEALDMDSGRLAVAITQAAAPHERMTLTLPALLNSRRIYLHISGRDKRLVYEDALGDGPVEEMPVRALLRQDLTPIDVFWAPKGE